MGVHIVVLQTQRIGCVPSCCRLNPSCVMCGGRSSSIEDPQYDLPTMERLSRLDPGVHPILSFSDGELPPHTPQAMCLGASPVSAERQHGQAHGSFHAAHRWHHFIQTDVFTWSLFSVYLLCLIVPDWLNPHGHFCFSVD